MEKIKTNRFWCLIFGSCGHNFGILLLRLFAAFMLAPHWLQKMQNFSELSTQFPDPFGLGSKFSLILIIATEFGASVLYALGLLTRPISIALMIGMAVAIMTAHQPFSLSGAEMPMLYLGMAAVLLFTGAGRYSIDNKLKPAGCI